MWQLKAQVSLERTSSLLTRQWRHAGGLHLVYDWRNYLLKSASKERAETLKHGLHHIVH